MEYKEFIEVIKANKELKNISYKKMAEAAGAHVSTIYDWFSFESIAYADLLICVIYETGCELVITDGIEEQTITSYDEAINIINKKIRASRIKNIDIAERMNASNMSITKWRHRKGGMRFDNFLKLFEVLGYEVKIVKR